MARKKTSEDGAETTEEVVETPETTSPEAKAEVEAPKTKIVKRDKHTFAF